MRLVLGIVLALLSCQNTGVSQEFTTPYSIIEEVNTKAPTLNSNRHLFNLYAEAANKLSMRGNYNLADSLFLLANDFIDERVDSTSLIKMMTNRARMYKIEGKYTYSIQDYFWLLDYHTRQKDINGIVLTYAQIAEFYRASENPSKSEEALARGKALLNQATDSAAVAYIYSRMAANQNQFFHNMDSTIYYAQVGLNWATQEKSALTRMLLLNELAYSFMHEDINDSSRILDFYNRAVEIGITYRYYRNLLSTYDNLALYNYRIDDYERVIEICRASIEMGMTNDWEYALDATYELLADNLQAIGQYEESNQYYKKAFAIRADNYRKSYNKEVAELQAIYEQEQAQLELENLQSQSKRERYALLGTIILAIIFSSLALFTFSLLRKVRRSNVILTESQEAIQQSNLELKEVISEKEILYKELNHRVKNNLTVLSGLIYMQEDLMKDENGRKLYKTLRNRIQTMAYVHEKLYSLTNSTKINFQDYLSELVPVLYESQTKTNIILDFQLNCRSLQLNIDKAIPLALIFNELITNTVKHGTSTQGKNLISIEATCLENNFRIEYKDSGPGLPPDYDIRKKDSMGIKIINMMITQLKARITQNSSKQGITYIIEVP